jgi:hypothetical protein
VVIVYISQGSKHHIFNKVVEMDFVIFLIIIAIQILHMLKNVKNIRKEIDTKMKIICDSQEEYDDLMKACLYLHDFDFQSKKKKSEGIDIETHPIISNIFHLYLGLEDFPDKKKFVTIRKKRKND